MLVHKFTISINIWHQTVDTCGTHCLVQTGAKESTFDVWMKQESDTVQALGMAYAERETIEACYRVIQEVSIHLPHDNSL